jgi:O-antigen/teichoic acid export membrane protein
MKALGRTGWGLADHAICAGTNFLLLALVARRVPVAELGGFALVYGYYVLAVELSRAACGEPLLVRQPRTGRVIAAATGTALAAGVAAGLLLALVWPRPEALVLAVLLPGLLVQDAYRMVFLACATPQRAFAIDMVWAVGQCAGTLVVLQISTALVPVLLVWGLSGTVAALLAIALAPAAPRPWLAGEFVREYGMLARPYVVEAGALASAGYTVLLAVGGIAGLAAAGALRAAQTLLGPLNVVLGAARLLGIAELARATHRRTQGVLSISGLLAAVCAVAGLAVLTLPDRVGTWLLGEAWAAAVPLLAALTLQRVAQGAAVGFTCALRADEAVRSLLWLRLAAAATTVLGGVAGAAWGGAPGAAAGLAASALAVLAAAVVLWWRNLSTVAEELA